MRGLAVYVTTEHQLRQLRSVQRRHIEGFKIWLANQPAGPGKPMSARAVKHRLGMLRVFFERIIEWGWTDAPKSCPILSIDMPLVDDPLPKFLDDVSSAALMHAAATAARPSTGSSSRSSPIAGRRGGVREVVSSEATDRTGR